MKFEELKAFAEEYEDYYLGIDDLPETLHLVEESDWIGGGKYQHSHLIVRNDQHDHFIIENSRSGSYHTDYHYNPPEVYRATMVTTTVNSWVRA